MFLTVTFDKEKSVQALLYISAKAPQPDLIHVLKILYFAEKMHLEKYGRFICGSTYAKLEYGPVPSEAYDILKAIDSRGDSYFLLKNPDIVENARKVFRVEKRGKYPYFHPISKLDTDLLSQSDMKCLDIAIEEVGPLSFPELFNKSHDQIWQAAEAEQMHFIPLETIVSCLPNRDALLEFLADRA